MRNSQECDSQGSRLFHHLALHIRRNERGGLIENGVLYQYSVSFEGEILEKRKKEKLALGL